MERYCLYVQSQNAVGDVVVEARGKAEDRQLSKVWAEFYEKGTDFAPPELIRRVLTSNQPKFYTKEDLVGGLQVADMFANPCKNHVLIQYGLMPRDDDDDLGCVSMMRSNRFSQIRLQLENLQRRRLRDEGAELHQNENAASDGGVPTTALAATSLLRPETALATLSAGKFKSQAVIVRTAATARRAAD